MRAIHNLYIGVTAFTMILAGCNADYNKTETGLVYKIFNKGNDKIESGDWLKVHYAAYLGDSLLFDSYEHIPAYGQYDSSQKNVHDFVDFLGEMKVGDSAIFSRSVDTLQKKGFIQFNEVFKTGGIIDGRITILQKFKTQEEMMADQTKENDIEKDREVAKLKTFLEEKKISNFTKTSNGVYVVVDEQGQGTAADSGYTVKVNYTGYLKNGKKFDSNTDTSFNHVEPFQFKVGTGQVIPGWDEGVKGLRQGSKARLFIPAMLAYGAQNQGERMPAFSDLIFEIEMLEVSAPAPQQ